MTMKLSLSLIGTFFCLFTSVDVSYAQKWQPGHFTDVKGNMEAGLIWVKPPGKGPIKDEAFIEFRENDKENPYKLSASDLKSFVIGRDSFVVAAEPQTGNWQYEVDFVKVVLDDDIKLYVFKSAGGSGGGGIQPEIGGGVGGGVGSGGSGFGGGVGAGISIPIGGGGGGGGHKIVYYYGETTANMKELTPVNFVDIMSDVMGDEPDVVEQIHEKKYNLTNIDKLIAYFKQVQASHTNSAGN